MPQLFRHQVLLRTRLELGLTQEQLAESVGVDVRTYRRYESGAVNDGGFSVRKPARHKLIQRLCAELGLPLSELVSDDAAMVEATMEKAAMENAAEEGVAAVPAQFVPELAMTLQKASHFVGREELLEQLWEWANGAKGPHVTAIVGVGGSGKTAVAQQLVQRLGSASKRFGVFVWSFYDDDRIEVFLQRSARYFCQNAVSQAEASERLLAALADGPSHLLVLDGAERVQSDGTGARAHGELADPLLRRLLLAVAQGLGNTRALVTSRHVLSDLEPWEGEGAQCLQLPSLTPEEGMALLRAWGVAGDAAVSRRVIEASGGHALSLAVAGSYASSFGVSELGAIADLDLSEHARDEPLARRLTNILSNYAAALPAFQRDLMARLSTLPSGADEVVLATLTHASPEIAGAVAGATREQLHRALVRLERLGLVYRAAARSDVSRWSSHPFVRDYFRSLLGAAEGPVQASLSAPPPTLADVPGTKAQAQTHLDTLHLDTLERVCEQLLNVGQPVEAFRVYRDALGGFGRLGLVLGEMSRGARILRQFGEPAAAGSPLIRLGPEWSGILLYERGLFAGALGDLAYAEYCYKQCIELASDVQSHQRLTVALRTLAYTQRLRGDLTTALATVRKSIELAGTHAQPEHQVLGMALQAAIFQDLGEVGQARIEFARLAERNQLGNARRGLWYAEHLLATDRYSEARELLQDNVAGSERRGWAGHAAHGRVLLGLTLLHLEPSAAPPMLGAARTWARSSGEVEMQLRVHDLACRVALSRAAHTQAAAELLAGERLVMASSAGLFRNRFASLRSALAVARE